MDETKVKERFLKVLGVGPQASASELDQAYKDQVKKWRTDGLEHNPELKAVADERLVEIKDAFDCLSEPEKLRKYVAKTKTEKGAVEKTVLKAIADRTAAQDAIAKAKDDKAAAEKALGHAEARKAAADKFMLRVVAEKTVADEMVRKAGAEKLAANLALEKAVKEKSDLEAVGAEAAARLAAWDPTHKSLGLFHAGARERGSWRSLLPSSQRMVWLGKWSVDLIIALLIVCAPILLYMTMGSHLIAPQPHYIQRR